jgi:hypothetical protein
MEQDFLLAGLLLSLPLFSVTSSLPDNHISHQKTVGRLWKLTKTMYFQCETSFTGYVPKGKAIQLQVWTGPEGSRRLRLPAFKTIDT